ncbi:hypothetical protein Trydic_g18458 [Trypoxylus dichotomus]
MAHGNIYPHRIPRESIKPPFAVSTPRPLQNDAGRAENPIRRRPGGVRTDFLKKIIASENPALKTAITQKIWGATKHRTVTETLKEL